MELIPLQTHWFSPVGSLSWLTELVAHLWAGWGLRPSWCFPDVFSGMWEPQPTPKGSLAESHVHHIWTGIDWNSASDRGSRCKQPMSSQTGELGEMLLPDPFQIKKGYGKAHGFSGEKKKKKLFPRSECFMQKYIFLFLYATRINPYTLLKLNITLRIYFNKNQSIYGKCFTKKKKIKIKTLLILF